MAHRREADLRRELEERSLGDAKASASSPVANASPNRLASENKATQTADADADAPLPAEQPAEPDRHNDTNITMPKEGPYAAEVKALREAVAKEALSEGPPGPPGEEAKSKPSARILRQWGEMGPGVPLSPELAEATKKSQVLASSCRITMAARASERPVSARHATNGGSKVHADDSRPE